MLDSIKSLFETKSSRLDTLLSKGCFVSFTETTDHLYPVLDSDTDTVVVCVSKSELLDASYLGDVRTSLIYNDAGLCELVAHHASSARTIHSRMVNNLVFNIPLYIGELK